MRAPGHLSLLLVTLSLLQIQCGSDEDAPAQKSFAPTSGSSGKGGASNAGSGGSRAGSAGTRNGGSGGTSSATGGTQGDAGDPSSGGDGEIPSTGGSGGSGTGGSAGSSAGRGGSSGRGGSGNSGSGGGAVAGAGNATAEMLEVSEDGHYLQVAGDDTPFLINSIAAWSLLVQLDENETTTFLDNCVQYSINSIRVNLVESLFLDAPAFTSRNVFGDEPWVGEAFESDLNPAYWDHVEWVLDQAKQRGIYVMAFPAYLGNGGGGEGWWSTKMKPAGADNLRDYGAQVGEVLARHDNVITVIGGDYWVGFDAQPSTEANIAVEDAMVEGLKSTDAPGRLYTAHWSGGTNSRDTNDAWLDFSLQYDIYNMYETAGLSLEAYQKTPAKPTFFGEGFYMRNPFTATRPTEQEVRSQYWRALMSGSCGQETGDEAVWPFNAPTGYVPTEDWHDHLDDPYWTHIAQVPAILGGLPWWRRVPDTGRDFVTGGTGSGANFVPCSATPEGDLLTCYCPASASLTVSLSAFAGNVDARWVDPTNGAVTDIASDEPNSGSATWATPGNNDAGDDDWILIATSR